MAAMTLDWLRLLPRYQQRMRMSRRVRTCPVGSLSIERSTRHCESKGRTSAQESSVYAYRAGSKRTEGDINEEPASGGADEVLQVPPLAEIPVRRPRRRTSASEEPRERTP
jgi:hypothetical protein